ncbi:MAG TPA: hypothetical protein VE996_10735 [Terriglobales bacterium]|nr:hypothetical protein [Terriglobales bacterium]
MKPLLVFAPVFLLAAALGGQQPANSAANPVPPLAAPPAPMPAASAPEPSLPAALAPNPNALRIYVQGLQGPDAEQIAGLIAQDLFQSKQVVVTENASNANLILKGVIYRRLDVPATAKSAHRRAQRRAATHRATAVSEPVGTSGDVSYINPQAIPDASTGTGGGAAMPPASEYSASGMPGADTALDLDPNLPSLGSLLNPGPTDLSRYQYHLDLELIAPDGDLVWISNRGPGAPQFAAANQAVATSLQPMLDLLEKSAQKPAPTAAAQPAAH